MNIMNKFKLKILVLKVLLIICAIGMTSTYIAIGKSSVFKSRIETFISVPLNEGQEYNVDMLKAKIESLENLNSIKDGLYSQIMEINQFSLIVSCVVFNLLLLALIFRLFFVKNQNSDNNCDTHN